MGFFIFFVNSRKTQILRVRLKALVAKMEFYSKGQKVFIVIGVFKYESVTQVHIIFILMVVLK